MKGTEKSKFVFKLVCPRRFQNTPPFSAPLGDIIMHDVEEVLSKFAEMSQLMNSENPNINCLRNLKSTLLVTIFHNFLFTQAYKGKI